MLDSEKNLNITHIFHTAFLTKEKIHKFGLSEYIKINSRIIDTVENLIIKNPDSRVVLTSSGAALPFLNTTEIKKTNENVYGILKAKEGK